MPDTSGRERTQDAGLRICNRNWGKLQQVTNRPIINIKRDDLTTEHEITYEHVNNRDVRELLDKRNIKPELLPPEEDAKVERRLAYEEKSYQKMLIHLKILIILKNKNLTPMSLRKSTDKRK